MDIKKRKKSKKKGKTKRMSPFIPTSKTMLIALNTTETLFIT